MASGLNLRLRDNLWQGIFVLLLSAVGALAGGVLGTHDLESILTGTLLGLVAGALMSGLVIMIYRVVRPTQTEMIPHDPPRDSS
jgi:hypothetical protein